MPNERIMYNCHVHTFTVAHVPPFIGFRILKVLMAPAFIRGILVPLIRLVSKIRYIRYLARYANWLNITSNTTQDKVFQELRSRYPQETKFVVLPMDLSHMKRGKSLEAPEDLAIQHRQLQEMRDRFPGAVIPFFAVDPRRQGILDALKEAVETQGFRGIKLYPNLGYAPAHPSMAPVWQYAHEKQLPVMTHCSRGGIHGYDDVLKRQVTSANADQYGAPELYKGILEKYTGMRLCLAHLGGQEEWDKFIEDPWYVPDKDGNLLEENKPQSWLAQILDMLRDPRYPNLYTDISYTIFYFQEFASALKVFLADPAVGSRVLFGSDYYMADLEDYSERKLSLNLRSILGEDVFWQIANSNPKGYLGIK